jgi:hypothetical protein
MPAVVEADRVGADQQAKDDPAGSQAAHEPAPESI